MSSGKARQIDENVDLIGYDLFGELIVGQAPRLNPFVGHPLKIVGHRIPQAAARITEDFDD
jgi:hypothetical protein